jgi:hypothetical protein
VYGASQFPTGGPLRISELRMRPSAVVGNAFTSTIPDLQIRMSTTAAQANNLSATFASNVGPNETVVFDGPITLSSRFVGPAGGPKEFDIIIPLATPFTYNPAAGNLLVEVRHASATGVANVDAGGALNDDCSRAYAFTATATTANTRDKAAEVLQLLYTAEPPPPPPPPPPPVLQLVYTAGPAQHPPVAKAVISPLVDLSPKIPDLLVLSANGSNATVKLDGTQSSDADGDALTYAWFVNGETTPFATGAEATAVLELGSHAITLTVSDGQENASATVEVEVITIHDMLNALIGLVDEANLLRKNQRPLVTALRQAQEAVQGGRFQVAIHQLESFQNKVAAQLAPSNAECAALLINGAQHVIDALAAPGP